MNRDGVQCGAIRFATSETQGMALIDHGLEWKQQFQEKGWEQ